MAPPHTPPQTPHKKTGPKTERREGDTVKKTELFKAVDTRGIKSLRLVFKQEGIPKATAERWLKMRRQVVPEACYRRIGAFRTGRPLKIPDEKLTAILDPKNDARDEGYERQIEIFSLGCTVRCLQNSLLTRKHNAKMYKKAKSKWVSQSNKETRQDYGHDHGDETVEHFWAFIGWTDEAHVDPTAMQAGYTLREEGPDQRYAPENVAEIPPLEGVVLHMSAFVSYHHKGDLIFYNDPDDVPELNVDVHVDAPKRKRPPKQRKNESEEQFYQSERYQAWLAAEPHDVEVQPKGNSMTQLFYTKKILPSHLKEMREVERKTGRKCILQEDNDPSHGTRSAVNYARAYKQKHNIETLEHPAQSPDLNPMEAVWNILKQRVRRRKWKNKDDLKRVILEEWEKVSLEEIQKRIDEMPERCSWLVNNSGKGIKSATW